MPVSSGRLVDRQRHRRRLVVWPAVGLMVQVVELDDRGVAALEQLDLELGRDRALLVGRDLLRERVHRVAPGPEAGLVRAQPLGQPGQGALEGVAVQVDHAGDDDAVDPLGVDWRRAGGDRGDVAQRLDLDQDIVRPALRQQRHVGEIGSHRPFRFEERQPAEKPGCRQPGPWERSDHDRAAATDPGRDPGHGRPADRPGRAHARASTGTAPRSRPGCRPAPGSTSSSSCSSIPAPSRRGAPLP